MTVTVRSLGTKSPEPMAWRLALAFALLLAVAPLRWRSLHRLRSMDSPCSTWASTWNTINPNWFDTMRLNKLPSFEGGVWRGRRRVRRSATDPPGRPGGSRLQPWASSETTFEFELFGTGVDAGQTTFRLRHAYGEFGKIGAGQNLEPLHGQTCFRTRLRTGARGHGLFPQRPGPQDAD